MLLSNITRAIYWSGFLFSNLLSGGIPLSAVYLPEQAGLVNLMGQFFAKLIFTGFFVIVAFEFLRKCFLMSVNSEARILFITSLIFLLLTYYVVSVFSAHSSEILTLIFYLLWFCLVGLSGYFIEGRLPNTETFKFTLLFTLIGVFIFFITSIGWSYIYGNCIRLFHLNLTLYISFGISIIVWTILLVSVISIEPA